MCVTGTSGVHISDYLHLRNLSKDSGVWSGHASQLLYPQRLEPVRLCHRDCGVRYLNDIPFFAVSVPMKVIMHLHIYFHPYYIFRWHNTLQLLSSVITVSSPAPLLNCSYLLYTFVPHFPPSPPFRFSRLLFHSWNN